MRLFATPYFVEEFLRISRRKYASAYGRVAKDLGAEFERLDSIPLILQSGSIITYLGYGEEHKPIKLRVANSTMQAGKSSGYRVILVTLDEEDAVVFVSIYPKVGPMAVSNPGADMLVAMMESYLDDDVYELQIENQELKILMED
ncbi:MAG: hypothetical protein U0176_05385 [Bacteroidia bacterium]